MKMNIGAILLCLGACIGIGSSARIVCYFLSWTIYRRELGEFAAKHVDPTLCTHIIYSSVGLNDDGSVHVLDDWELNGLEEIKHLQSLRDQNPNLELLLSMGGWGEGSSTYSDVAADSDKRQALIESVINFLGKNEFDGFDLDWEYPGRRDDSDLEHDADNFVILLEELYKALKAEEYTFSATVSGAVWYIIGSYPDARAVSENVDMLNVRTFGYHGSWEGYVGHYAPLYASHLDISETDKTLNVETGVLHWLDYGADPSKINLGIGSYGSSFTLANAVKHELYSPIDGPGDAGPYTQETGLLGYYEICGLYSNWTYFWDDEQQVPHRYGSTQWVGYENEESIQAKLDFANKYYLGGVMFFSLDTDDFLGSCGYGKFPLLQYINDNI